MTTERLCAQCNEPIAPHKRPHTKFCGEKCRRKAEHKRGWAGGWIKKYHERRYNELVHYTKEWQKANPDRVKASRQKHSVKHARQSKAWRQRNPERTRQLRLESAKRHPEAAMARSRRWVLRNPDKMKFHRDRWKNNNIPRVRANKRERDARQLNATPSWLTQEQRAEMIAVYERCANMKKATGIPYEVDHIIPLRGKTVCGLHVPWNLQILTRSENAKKHNKLLAA